MYMISHLEEKRFMYANFEPKIYLKNGKSRGAKYTRRRLKLRSKEL